MCFWELDKPEPVRESPDALASRVPPAMRQDALNAIRGILRDTDLSPADRTYYEAVRDALAQSG